MFFVNRGDLTDELPPRDVAADGFNAPLLPNVTRFNIKKLDCQTFFRSLELKFVRIRQQMFLFYNNNERTTFYFAHDE